ncbi:MAG: glycosyltransferase family 4 protein [Mucilaginibacter sp.]
MTSKIKILFITPQGVHNKVGHAGGKTLNFYLDKFSRDLDFDVGVAYLGDVEKDYQLMLEQYLSVKIISGFKSKKFYEKLWDGLRFRCVYPLLKKIDPKYYITNNFKKRRLQKVLRNVQKENFRPEIIIAEFADPIYWIDEIKSIFPGVLIVASCHDVTFLSVKRALINKKSNRFFYKEYYETFKKAEIRRLNSFDLVVPHNSKDKILLENEKDYKNNNTHVISPFYDKYELTDSSEKNSIVFFGAMSRLENQNAVEWFLKNIWPQVNSYFNGAVKFVIVGGGLPNNKHKEYMQYENVEVTGFVVNPQTIFGAAFCFVVPLQLGAGIKVKVLEAMYAGVPVITNGIGIEGIPAKNNYDYLHCELPIDFFNAIIKLKTDTEFQKAISVNSKQTIINNFNLEASYLAYRDILLKIKKARG